MEDLLLQILSDDPLKRPRFSEIVSQLEKFPKEKPDEKEFVEVFKAELNSKKGIEFQQNLFQLFESFPIFYFNADLNEAERIINEIQHLLLSTENPNNDDLNQMKILSGDLLMCQKKYDLAEQKYLSCNFPKDKINEQNHKEVRLAILYKAIVIELKNKTKLEEYNLKLQNSIKNLEKQPETADSEEKYGKRRELNGFEFMMDNLMGKNTMTAASKKKQDFEYFKNQIRKQTKNKEILEKLNHFFQALENNQLQKEQLSLYSEIASFLLINFDQTIAFWQQVATQLAFSEDKNME